MTDQVNVWAVIVSWNTRADTLQCLAALGRSAPRPRVVLVDNASSDGTVAAVARQFPDVEVIGNTRNRQFAAGANAGLRHALQRGAQWLWVLNPDTYPAPDALATLLAVAQADARTAIVGPRLVHPDGRVVAGADCDFARGAVREPPVLPGDPPREVDYVWGCALLVRAEALARVGLFDERYVAYFEDTDLCLRARQAGYRVLGVPAARVEHYGGRASDQVFLQQAYLRGRNWLRCFVQHAPPGQRLAAALAVGCYRLPKYAWDSARRYVARRMRPKGRPVRL